MKKREITNKDLDQLFNNIIEQTPLVSEKQVDSLLNNRPKSNLVSAVKRFFQYHLNIFLLCTAIVLMIVVAFVWIKSNDQSDEIVKQNNTRENLIAPISADTIVAEPANIIHREISQNIADGETVLAESNAKTITDVPVEKAKSESDIYKHFDKKFQVFSIQTNRDTTITCKEGTSIKIKANTFISEKEGNIISGTVQVGVKEYYKMSDIVLSSLTTTSGDKILETGGMLHIAASFNNENCSIKSGSNIEIGFPYSNKKDDMALFYGERSNNKIDWKLASRTEEIIIVDELIIGDSEPETEMQTFVIVEDMPEFPGGEMAMQKYLEQNVQYPFSALENKIEGKVYVSFVIDKSGYVNNISVVKSLDKILDKVAVYVVSNMPKWKPGKQRGKSVNVSYTVSVPFLAKNDDLTPEEIKRSIEFEEKLKDFKYDIETNRYFTNRKIFNEFEKKVKSDSLQDSDIKEVNRYIFSVTQLGWINCDRFYKNYNPLVNFFIRNDNSSKTIVNVVFRRFKALIPGKKQSGKITFKNIPVGEDVTIVALKTVNNKIFLSVKETEVTKNGEIVLDFNQVTMELLQKEMEKLNKYY